MSWRQCRGNRRNRSTVSFQAPSSPSTAHRLDLVKTNAAATVLFGLESTTNVARIFRRRQWWNMYVLHVQFSSVHLTCPSRLNGDRAEHTPCPWSPCCAPRFARARDPQRAARTTRWIGRSVRPCESTCGRGVPSPPPAPAVVKV